MQTQNVNLKTNTTITRCLRANKTSQHIKTCHMRHIFTLGDQTIKKICSHNNLLNATIQSHPIKMGCCNTKSQCLIVTTINPIWHSHPVHHGTKASTICSHKSKENIIFAHNFIIIQNTNQASHCFDFHLYIFPCKRISYIKPIAINTHIDCANN